jgi:hypothetical protein
VLLQVGWFDMDENSTAKLVPKLVSDASHIRGAVGDKLGLILQASVTLAAAYAVAFV